MINNQTRPYRAYDTDRRLKVLFEEGAAIRNTLRDPREYHITSVAASMLHRVWQEKVCTRLSNEDLELFLAFSKPVSRDSDRKQDVVSCIERQVKFIEGLLSDYD
jgi:hypothetical protein